MSDTQLFERPTPLLHRFQRIASLAALIGLSSIGLAQQEAPPFKEVGLTRDTGWLVNNGTQTEIVTSFPVTIDGAGWIRLYFEEIELGGNARNGQGAVLRITSYLDAGVQELNAIHCEQWQNSSAYFNGDTVQVEVIAPPGTSSRLKLRSADAGLAAQPQETICGPVDDRMLSSDPRSGRIVPIGCTGWLIDDCRQCALSAGHCAGGSFSVLQFNVPLSTNSGSTQNPSPNDQYAIQGNSIQSTNGGVGNDWAYFGAFANSNTGLTPAEAQGGTYELAAPPNNPAGNTIRITGYGTDSTPDSTYNQTQQTHTGDMATSSSSTVQYSVDTTGGNSGSPVIWEETGQAIGIHTHGGCSSTGGANSGTASTMSGLANALANPRGICLAGFTFPNGIPSLLSPTSVNTFSAQVSGDPDGSGVLLHYRANPGDAFVQHPMQALGNGNYEVGLAPSACGDSPQFFFSFVDLACGTRLFPSAGAANPLPAIVGGLDPVLSDNFESDNGWTTSILGATTGQWQRGVPVNDANWAYDPTSDSDSSGSAFLTQNEFGNTDIDGGSVRLISPNLNLGQGATIQYDYYLFMTNDNGDDRLLVEASANGLNGPWIEIERHDTSGGTEWRSNLIIPADMAAAGFVPSSQTRVRFTANDGGDASIVEAGLDAFFAGVISCDDNVGSNFCQSGAFGSVINATGTTSVSQNDLVLAASAPQFKPGLFIYSNLQQQAPFGQGFLCVNGSAGIFRLPLTFSGSAGVLEHNLDVANPPNPFGLISPGTTWNFQAWFRVGTTFDLSDGLSVQFTP